jgi:hypothetical protein
MSRYRLLPAPAQEAVLRDHCAQARYVWNLAVEQHGHWRPGRASAPGYLEQCRQLTQARAEYPWLAAGSQTVQQQALRDFAQAVAAFFDPGNPAGRPLWRKAGRDEGFRITGRRGRQWDVRRVSRYVGQVWVPKAGWVRFRWSRAVPPGVKSYRVTMDRAGRWHVAFAAVPEPVPAPGTGEAVGIDRGVAVSAAPRPERPTEGRAEPGDPVPGLGPAGPPPAGQGPRPGREGHAALHQPAVLGVRARGPAVAREPSAVCVHGLPLRR